MAATTTQTLPVFEPPPKVAHNHKRSRSSTIFSITAITQTLKSKSSQLQLPTFKLPQPQQKQNESKHKYRHSISRPISIDDAAMRRTEAASRSSFASSMTSPVTSPLSSPSFVSPPRQMSNHSTSSWSTLPVSPPYATRVGSRQGANSPNPQRERPYSPAPMASVDNLRLYSPYDPRPAPAAETVRPRARVGLPPNPRAKGHPPATSGQPLVLQQRSQQQQPSDHFISAPSPRPTPPIQAPPMEEDPETEIEDDSSCDDEDDGTNALPREQEEEASVLDSATSSPETAKSKRRKAPSPILVPVKLDSGWQLCDTDERLKDGRGAGEGTVLGGKAAWGGIAERRAASRAGGLVA